MMWKLLFCMHIVNILRFFRTGLQGRTVCNWLVISYINIFEKTNLTIHTHERILLRFVVLCLESFKPYLSALSFDHVVRMDAFLTKLVVQINANLIQSVIISIGYNSTIVFEVNYLSKKNRGISINNIMIGGKQIAWSSQYANDNKFYRTFNFF